MAGHRIYGVSFASVYPAYLAGLSYDLSADGTGFEIQVSGYSDEQLTLLQTVLDRFTTLQVDPERFALFKDELLREWSNYRDERPYSQTYGALGYLLLSSRWPPEALTAALESRSLADLERWRAERLSGFNALALHHGNVDGRDGPAMTIDRNVYPWPAISIANARPSRPSAPCARANWCVMHSLRFSPGARCTIR